MVNIFSFKPYLDVQKSVKFLESEFSRGISDNYTLALVSYALSLVGSPKAKEALNLLTGRAEQEGNTRSHPVWGCETVRSCTVRYVN